MVKGHQLTKSETVFPSNGKKFEGNYQKTYRSPATLKAIWIDNMLATLYALLSPNTKFLPAWKKFYYRPAYGWNHSPLSKKKTKMLALTWTSSSGVPPGTLWWRGWSPAPHPAQTAHPHTCNKRGVAGTNNS